MAKLPYINLPDVEARKRLIMRVYALQGAPYDSFYWNAWCEDNPRSTCVILGTYCNVRLRYSATDSPFTKPHAYLPMNSADQFVAYAKRLCGERAARRQADSANNMDEIFALFNA